MHELISFQFFQCGTESFVGNPTDISFYFIEPYDAKFHSSIEDRHFIFLVYQGKGVAEARVFEAFIGNTSALVKAFVRGAESVGNEVTEFFLDRMEIHGCKGCFGGHSSQSCPCVQKDDMDKIYPVVRESEVIVLATTLYYWNMSGQIRTAIDRLFALEEGDGNLLRGHVLAGGNGDVGDIEGKAELQQAYELGKSIQ